MKTMRIGDLVVATGAEYRRGTLDYYFTDKKVSLRPDWQLTKLLMDSAMKEGIEYYAGRVFSSDAFYIEDPDFISRSTREGYVAVQMECATLFGLGTLRDVKAACVLLVSDNLPRGQLMADADALYERTLNVGRLTLKSLGKLQMLRKSTGKAS